MAQEMNSDVPHADDFVDESGWTSMEPEGAGHHEHRGFQEQNEHRGEDAPEPWRGESGMQDQADRWEGRMHPHDIIQRGLIPAEGDGYGAPE
ncbi:MAG: hypothetical protein JWP91_3734 [Fibrobacteres bacterium]|nr:hypothetical protein [Fibrobacterota bacterium]